MSLAIPTICLTKGPWIGTLRHLVASVRSDLVLVSPFIKARPVEQVLAELAQRGLTTSVRLVVLTNLRTQSVLDGSLDLEALVSMSKTVPKLEVNHLPGLHAKVYIADNQMAIVTSANLTDPGITGNLEYGVIFNDRSTVKEIRRDFENYALLGARVEAAELGALLDEANELKTLFKRAERSIHSDARRAFTEKLEATQILLLRQRARGKTTHAILVDTIRFLLRKGPLRTTELHPLIQQLHPDVCDDSIDLVIEGVHFGKRWKHHVRNAQVFLRRAGRIRFDGKNWHLVSG